MEEVSLLIVDPLVSAVMGDSHKNAEVRRGLAPMVDLAARLDAALLGITHYSKGTHGRDPLERVSGSLAFGALARIVLGTVKQDAEEGQPQRMMLARAKSNIGPDGGGFTYGFEQIALPDHPQLTASRIAWGTAVEGTARELLAEAEPSGESGDDAAAFLRDLLAHGSRAAKDVYREAESAGYSRDQMKRAKRRTGVEAVKTGMDGGWLWRLPFAEGSAGIPEEREGSAPGESAPFARFDALPLPSDGDSEVFEV
jgi:RecA-family ATPase